MKNENTRERISLKNAIILLGKALGLSYRVRTKASIAVSLIGFVAALLPSLISRSLQGFTDSMYTLYMEGVPALRTALILFGILVALYTGQAVYDSLSAYYNRVDAIHIHTFLREQLIRISCRVQYKYIDNYDNFKERSEFIKTNTGELLANSIQQILVVLQSIITFVSLLVLIWQVDWMIVVVLLVTTVPSVILAYLQKDDDYRRRTKWMKEGALMIHYYWDGTRQNRMNEVRFQGLHDYIRRKWRDMGDRFIAAKNAMTKKHVLYNSIADILRNGVYVFVLIVVGLKIFDDPSVGLGMFMLVMTGASQFQKVATTIFVSSAQIIGNVKYFEEFFAFYDLEMDEADEHAKPIENPDITFRDVSFAYPNTDHEVLHNINVTIPYGQKVAIVGENGSGKSTFVNLLCGMYNSYRGEIKVGGKSLVENVSAVRETLAVVFQDFGKYEDSIRYNIKVSDLAKEATDEEILALTKVTGAYDAIKARPAGLDEQVGTFAEQASNFSGGEWQKVALTRALYRDQANIVILDEPTAALDPMAEATLYRNFTPMTGPRTTLMISHRLGFTSFIDRILVFDNGFIVEDGTHEELMKLNGHYAKMYRAQSQWYQ